MDGEHGELDRERPFYVLSVGTELGKFQFLGVPFLLACYSSVRLHSNLTIPGTFCPGKQLN